MYLFAFIFIIVWMIWVFGWTKQSGYGLIAVTAVCLLPIQMASPVAADGSIKMSVPAETQLAAPSLDPVENPLETTAAPPRQPQIQSVGSQDVSECKLVDYCCSVSCCQWGGTGGTAVCLEQCCTQTCQRLVC